MLSTENGIDLAGFGDRLVEQQYSTGLGEPTSPGTDPTNAQTTRAAKESEQYVPIANVNRMMHTVVGDDVKIMRDTKELLQESVSEFILLLTGEATEVCNADGRKTISAEDVLTVVQNVGFERYEPYLRAMHQCIRKKGH
ncbi:Histone-like transcription factor (CBF/NF-Y) and archaeal histone [Carpediemonas membranifera]|uniref:Histone-like transcription factor (CBF/NF-Y) and archaeal histone n=1 Tax=Carpediemonas membranifera TaxID=201153 RepID=A0A8J6AU20_9EUKA|nr:Histone-like transcription factor (CBF/NF-Y) and archaeal histone [Carpediemonas membranifera]|eukprot:KAG9391530.1 Histone-like transcription factor (CBF/NF-Y) and archaeal histone [Carpediemonas membranifera]